VCRSRAQIANGGNASPSSGERRNELERGGHNANARRRASSGRPVADSADPGSNIGGVRPCRRRRLVGHGGSV
jgi:hypothetical protein